MKDFHVRQGAHWMAMALFFAVAGCGGDSGTNGGVKSRVVCKSERKLLDASVRLPWRPPSVREA